MNFAKKVDFGSLAKRKKREREIRAGRSGEHGPGSGTLSLFFLLASESKSTFLAKLIYRDGDLHRFSFP